MCGVCGGALSPLTGQQRHDIEGHVQQQQPAHLQWQDAHQQDLLTRIVHGSQSQDRQHRSGRPEDVGLRLEEAAEDKRDDARPDGAGQVKPEEFAFTEDGEHHATGEVQAEHVHHQMQQIQAIVTEGVGQQTPDLTALKDFPHTQFQPVFGNRNALNTEGSFDVGGGEKLQDEDCDGDRDEFAQHCQGGSGESTRGLIIFITKIVAVFESHTGRILQVGC